MAAATEEPPVVEGRSVADLAAEREARANGTPPEGDVVEPPEVEEDDDGQLTIAGTKPTLTLNPGTKKPEVSVLKLASINLPIIAIGEKGKTAAQFAQEDEAWVAVRICIRDVNFKGEMKDRKLNRVRREHVAVPIDVVALPVGYTPYD